MRSEVHKLQLLPMTCSACFSWCFLEERWERMMSDTKEDVENEAGVLKFAIFKKRKTSWSLINKRILLSYLKKLTYLLKLYYRIKQINLNKIAFKIKLLSLLEWFLNFHVWRLAVNLRGFQLDKHLFDVLESVLPRLGFLGFCRIVGSELLRTDLLIIWRWRSFEGQSTRVNDGVFVWKLPLGMVRWLSSVTNSEWRWRWRRWRRVALAGKFHGMLDWRTKCLVILRVGKEVRIVDVRAERGRRSKMLGESGLVVVHLHRLFVELGESCHVTGVYPRTEDCCCVRRTSEQQGTERHGVGSS